jgi:hypothetical protein
MNSAHCANCGSLVPAGANACTICGRPYGADAWKVSGVPSRAAAGAPAGAPTNAQGSYGAAAPGGATAALPGYAPAAPAQYPVGSDLPAASSGGLGDFFAFRTMVSHGLLKVVYLLGFLALTLSAVLSGLNGANGYLNGLLILVVGNVLWRVFCEWLILFFSMHERLASIERELRRR